MAVRVVRLLVIGLAAAVALGGAAMLWRHQAAPVPPSGTRVPAGLSGPTAQQEGDVLSQGAPSASLPAPRVPRAAPRPVVPSTETPGPVPRPPRDAAVPPDRARLGQAAPPPAASPRDRASRPERSSGRSSPDESAASQGSAAAGSPQAPAAPQGAADAAGGGAGGTTGSAISGSGPPLAAAAPAPVPPVISPPRVLSTGTMEYPGDALQLTLKRQDLGASLTIVAPDGVVRLRALVLADGSVRSVDVVGTSGSNTLDRSAADAVRHWQFAPATRDGTPIDAYVTLRIRYVVR